MNPDSSRLHHLFAAHSDGTITAEEHSELQEHLRADPATRRLWFAHQDVEAGLQKIAQTATQPAVVSPGHSRWLAWRPLTAAAAGIVLGLFFATVAWAVTSPRAVATASRLPALVDESFEQRAGRLAPGFPSVFGHWSGDESEVVEPPTAVTPDGKKALRFVRAEREPTLPNYGAASCDVYQLVDLRSLKAGTVPDEATLELSVRYLDARESAGEPMKFISRLYVFAGSPEALPAEWPLTQKEALAAGSGCTDSLGGAPLAWHIVTTKVLLPPQADFAVVHLVAHKPNAPAGTGVMFGSQFADDVRLTLKTQPKLPVRVARR